MGIARQGLVVAIPVAAILVALVAGAAGAGRGGPAASDIAGARQAAAQLGEALRGRLTEAMRSGGPVAAVSVCTEAAPGIAQSVSEASGYTVGRTALRVRNPANAPDAWERRQLEFFVEAVAAGQPAAGLERAEVMETASGPVFRWARPILLEPACAACHGVAVEPSLLAHIRSIYPDDTATGFTVGEVRGMFTVTKPLSTD